MKKCYGCGVELQIENKDSEGYVPKLSDSTELCQRCFQLAHYNQNKTNIDAPDFLLMLDETLEKYTEKDTLILYIVDLLDVSSTQIPGIGRRFKGYEVVLVANKQDLMPSTISYHKMERWLSRELREEGIVPSLVWTTSSTQYQGFEKLVSILQTDYSEFKNILVVGTTNVGKSTFINHFYHVITGDKLKITTSNVPGTTLRPIETPLPNNTLLIDTPGIINEAQMIHYLSQETKKHALPSKQLRPRVFQIYEPSVFFIEHFGYISYTGTAPISIVFYLANTIEIHRSKYENKDRLLANKTLFAFPNEHDSYVNQPRKETHINAIDKKFDCTISGLGYFTVHDLKGSITCNFADVIDIKSRKALI